MSPISSPNRSDDRHELAAGMKALRLDAGVSTTELARRLDWSQSKVSRVERGVTLAKPAEVEQWARALRAPSRARASLMQLAERQGIELREWKREFAPGRRRLQEEIGQLEMAASVIWVCPLEVVPGVAQTPQYAEVMFRIGRESPIPEHEVAEAVAGRIARQQALRDGGKKWNLLFTETALRRSLLTREEMGEQLRRLVEVSRMDNVEMGVIPFSARERTHTYHGFTVLGDPGRDDNSMVVVETVTRSLTVRAPEEVREYIEHYRRLAEGAVFGDELRRLLQEISAEAPWS